MELTDKTQRHEEAALIMQAPEPEVERSQNNIEGQNG